MSVRAGGGLNLLCPACGERLSDDLACARGHHYGTVNDVPALVMTGHAIRESFTAEWDAFGDLERVWGQDTDERLREFQEQIGSVDLEGKVVWDAGCGPGLLADAITTLGCQVVATDISDSVFTAAKRFAANPRLRFVQADLARPLFPPATFDLIHCAGVLHHTPNTRETLEAVLPALKPSGTIFVWLYWKVPGWKFKLRSVIRRAVVPLPLAVRRAVSYAYVPVVALGGRGGASFRRGGASLRELAVVQLDYFTPKYRHEHTPAEVHGWFRDLGLTEVATSWEGVNGFGVRGTRLRST